MGFSKWVGDNSSTILTVVGIGTSILAGVLFARAGMKTSVELEEARESRIDESEPDISPKEKAKIVARNMWIPCAVEGLSIFAILGGNHIKDVKTTAAITAANATANMATKALEDYRQGAKDEFGQTADRKITDRVAQKRVDDDYDQLPDGHMPQVMNQRQPGDVLCKEEISQRYFWSNAEKIRRAENMMVKQINDDFSANLNDWYDHLGIECVAEGVGDYLEWDTYDKFGIVISATKTYDEEPCLYVMYDYNYPHDHRDA